MSSEISIKIESLSKRYEIYSKPSDRLKQMIFPRIFSAVGLPVKKYHEEFWALRDISLEIKKGETIGVVGLNGSGKSTLLNLVCGTLAPTTGTVSTQGRIAALLELGTGFNPEFTGKENVYLNGKILGLSQQEIESKYREIVNFADIGDFIDQPVKRYSSGMYVRLAFAVIANVDADILIIDEALAVGDVVFSQKCMRFLRNFKKHGTVLFVSHNSGAVVGLCDRAVWLEKGKAQAIGPAKSVCDLYLARRYQSQPLEKPGFETGRTEAPSEIRKIQSTRDMRMEFINNSNLRNDIKVFEFTNVKSGFGNNEASIIYAGLEDLAGNRLSWLVGGETIKIVITAKIFRDCSNIVMGFCLKDRLGQTLVGQNTYIDTHQDPVSAFTGDSVTANFVFQFPILPKGHYSVDVAIADGIPPDVTQLQWAHDAFTLESISSSAAGCLVGIPFDRIELRKVTEGTVYET